MKRLIGLATAVVAVLGVTGCAPQQPRAALSPNPKTSVQLRALALTVKTAPPGVGVLSLNPVDDRKVYTNLGGGARPRCAYLNQLSSKFVYGSTLDQPVGSTSVSLADSNSENDDWFAFERLTSYAPGLAHFVMRDLTDQLNGCTVYGVGDQTYRTSYATGPALGDESLKVALRVSKEYRDPITSEADIVLIRSGDNLIIIEEVQHLPGARTPLDVVAAAAYRAFTTG